MSRTIYNRNIDTYAPEDFPAGARSVLLSTPSRFHVASGLIYFIGVAFVGTLAAAVLTTLGPQIARYMSGYVFAVVSFVAVLIAVWFLLGHQYQNALKAIAFPSVIALAAWTGMRAQAPAFAYVALLMSGVLLAVLFSDRILAHVMAWRIRSLTTSLKNKRWSDRMFEGCVLYDATAAFAPAVVGLVILRWLQRSAEPQPLWSSKAMCIVVLLFVTWSIAWNVLRDGKFRAFINAFSRWVNYDGPIQRSNVQTPLGLSTDVWWRRVQPGVVTFVIALGMLPAASYFPVGMIAGLGPWQRGVSFDVDELQEAPDDIEMMESLSDSQQRYFEELGTAERRRAYIRDLQREFVAEQHRRQSSGRSTALIQTLNGRPESWATIALNDAMVQRSPAIIWTLTGAVVLSLTLPGLTVLSILFTALGPALQSVPEAEVEDDDIDELSWDSIVSRIQGSADDEERNSIYVGRQWSNYVPTLIPRKAFHEHGWVLGDSGSGKTARTLSPIIAQLIRMSARDARAKNDQFAPGSVVILDLKGDKTLFCGARIEAEQAGLPFKFLTVQPGYPSYAFNPLQQQHLDGLSKTQLAGFLMQSLGLEFGDSYGRSYFSMAPRSVLRGILKAREVQSFRELEPLCEEKNRVAFQIRKRDWEQADQLFGTIESLADLDALNVTAATAPADVIDHRIDMSQVLETPQVLYFHLPVMMDAANSRHIGRTALFSLLTAAMLRQLKETQPTPVYLFIDEFQEIASEHLEVVLRQARSLNIGAILSHQTMSDLKKHGKLDLIPTVQGNTRFKMFHSFSDQQTLKMMVEASGERISKFRSQGTTPSGETSSLSEQLTPRITPNHLIEFSNDEDMAVLQLQRGSGFAQFRGYPTPVYTEFHIEEREKDRREALPWPNPVGTLIQSSTDERSEMPVETTKTQPAPAGSMQNRFREKHDEQQAKKRKDA